MSDHKPHSNQPLTHLSGELIEGYLNGTLSKELRAKVEAYLADNPFEREALEGFSPLKTENIREDLMEIDKRLSKRTRVQVPRKIWWQVAAIFILVAISGLVIYLMVPQNDQSTITVLQDSVEVDLPGEGQADLSDELDNERTAEAQPRDAAGTQALDEDIPTAREKQIIEEPGQKSMENVQPEPGPEYEIYEDHEEIAAQSSSSAAVEKKSPRPQGVQNRLQQGLDYESSPIPDSVRVVVGKVIHQHTGDPIMGVEVMVKGTAISGISDQNGFFHLEAPISADYLVAEDTRYHREEVPLIEQPQVNVVLEQTASRAAKEKTATTATPSAFKDNLVDSSNDDNLLNASAPANFSNYLYQNLQYPESARVHDVTGTIKLSFRVNIDGSLSDFEVLEKLGYGCEEEAIKVLKRGPAWLPFQIDGRKVRSKATIKIHFPPKDPNDEN